MSSAVRTCRAWRTWYAWPTHCRRHCGWAAGRDGCRIDPLVPEGWQPIARVASFGDALRELGLVS
ncbi:hypothetical protein [Micromonospora sp. NPDC003241]